MSSSLDSPQGTKNARIPSINVGHLGLYLVKTLTWQLFLTCWKDEFYSEMAARVLAKVHQVAKTQLQCYVEIIFHTYNKISTQPLNLLDGKYS